MKIAPKKIEIDASLREMLDWVLLEKECNSKGVCNDEGFDVFYFKRVGQVMIMNDKCYSMHTGKRMKHLL